MKIIYQSEYGVAVLVPADCGLSILEIGMKDVPDGVPFWIVEDNELPVDAPQEAWEIEVSSMGDPSGIGGTYEEKNDDQN